MHGVRSAAAAASGDPQGMRRAARRRMPASAAASATETWCPAGEAAGVRHAPACPADHWLLLTTCTTVCAHMPRPRVPCGQGAVALLPVSDWLLLRMEDAPDSVHQISHCERFLKQILARIEGNVVCDRGIGIARYVEHAQS